MVIALVGPAQMIKSAIGSVFGVQALASGMVARYGASARSGEVTAASPTGSRSGSKDDAGQGARGHTYRDAAGRQPAKQGMCENGVDRPRFAHNPEVVGSNPTPATSRNGPREIIPRAVSRAL